MLSKLKRVFIEGLRRYVSRSKDDDLPWGQFGDSPCRGFDDDPELSWMHPPADPQHFTKPWFEENGWQLRRGDLGKVRSGRVAWLLMTTG